MLQAPVRAKERIHAALAHRLGVLIVSGHYPAGAVLDNEIAFAEQLEVSRSAYREAVRTLAAKGLVESRPKRGTRVTPPARWHLLDPEVLAWFFESEPSDAFLQGLFELRMIVEPQAAALAAVRRGPADLARLRRALQLMEQATLVEEAGRQADRDFHDAVLEATRNPALVALSSGIGAAVRWTTLYKQRRRALPRDPVPDHWKVFDAIAAGGPEAANAAMRTLIELAQNDMQLPVQAETRAACETSIV